MSIQIDNLLKIYGAQRAVDNLSFEAPKGKITGFLGPNGAGKSTTMKIATGYILPTAGQVIVNGIDVVAHPLEAKRIIGYLPEHNPLYLDMYIKEYLRFVAKSYGFDKSKVNRKVAETIELVGLELEHKKKIGALSKGYRQRVGLGQALIGEPEVLILDEPTSGLDPNQIVEIREVIKQVSQDKTVILSTHIMQEVEALCDKVVVINKGKLVADEALHTFKKRLTRTSGFVLSFESNIDPTPLVNAGFEVEKQSPTSFIVDGSTANLRSGIMAVITENDWPLTSLTQSGGSLEEIFQDLTKGES
ncbi:MAG: ABC-2 type transport system ATP-binding protein [Cyclobacteriaceae bacterium]|jgi:ABC-2 type transport system ATP-binding protein